MAGKPQPSQLGF